MAETHIPKSAELVLVNRGWYTSWRVVYICSCGSRLRQHGISTIAHFRPDTIGYAAVCRALDQVETEARSKAAASGVAPA